MSKVLPELVLRPKDEEIVVKTPECSEITPKRDDWTSKKVLKRVVDWYNKEMENHGIQIESYFDHENFNYVLNLLEFNLDRKVVGEELSRRAWKHFEHYKSLDCTEIKTSVIGIYNKLSKIVGWDKKLRKDLTCKNCYNCPIPAYWVG